MSKKIYDCFNFYNEFEILEMRLNILDEVVDKFVLVESPLTHSGLSKKFYFDENKERFSKFLDKIIHIKIDKVPDDFLNLTESDDECISDINRFIENTNCFNRVTEMHFARDFYQKEYIRKGLINCNDDDIIISSDVDEIPNPEILKRISDFDMNKFYTFEQNTYYYYLNMFKEKWKGSRMGLYKNLKRYSYNTLRSQDNEIINNGGWHFSFMGGEEKVIEKMTVYSHQEYNSDYYKSNIKNNIENNIDPFGRSFLTLCNIDETYPKYILNNLDKYKEMIKK